MTTKAIYISIFSIGLLSAILMVIISILSLLPKSEPENIIGGSDFSSAVFSS